VTFSNATGGSFTLSSAALPGNTGFLAPDVFTTAVLPYGATAAQVQLALQALPNIGLNNVVVSSTDANHYSITFINALGGAALPTLYVNNFLTGSAPAASVVMLPV